MSVCNEKHRKASEKKIIGLILLRTMWNYERQHGHDGHNRFHAIAQTSQKNKLSIERSLCTTTRGSFASVIRSKKVLRQ